MKYCSIGCLITHKLPCTQCYNIRGMILLQIFLDFSLLVGKNAKNSRKKFFYLQLTIWYQLWDDGKDHVTRQEKKEMRDVSTSHLQFPSNRLQAEKLYEHPLHIEMNFCITILVLFLFLVSKCGI